MEREEQISNFCPLEGSAVSFGSCVSIVCVVRKDSLKFDLCFCVLDKKTTQDPHKNKNTTPNNNNWLTMISECCSIMKEETTETTSSPSPLLDDATRLSYADLSKLWSLGHVRNDSSASLASSEVSEISEQDDEEEEVEESVDFGEQDDEVARDVSVDSSASRSSVCSSSSKRSVSFSSELSVRTHALVVGNSPSCPLLPLQLDWRYDEETVDLDEHESSLTTRRRRRRGPRKLLFCERSDLLQDVGGYSPKELMKMKREALQRMKEEEDAAKAQDLATDDE